MLSLEKAEAAAYGKKILSLKNGYMLWDAAPDLILPSYKKFFMEKKRISREEFVSIMGYLFSKLIKITVIILISLPRQTTKVLFNFILITLTI